MVLQKHDYPILEFDDSHKAVIMPDHDGLDIKLPKKTVFGFLGDEIDNYAKKVGAKIVGEFVSATKIYPVYVIEFKKTPSSKWSRDPQEPVLMTSRTPYPISQSINWVAGAEPTGA